MAGAGRVPARHRQGDVLWPCAHRGHGRSAVIANQRGVIKGAAGERPRFGGIVYTESAEKVAYFIETREPRAASHPLRSGCERIHGGPRGRAIGIIRAGARFVEAMATAVVPKIVLTVNHASGAGLLRDGGAGIRSRLHLLLAHRAHGRDGRRGGDDGRAWPRDRAAQAGRQAARPTRRRPSTSMRADYEQQLDAKLRRRPRLCGCDRDAGRDARPARIPSSRRANYAGPHLGPFVLPPLDAALPSGPNAPRSPACARRSSASPVRLRGQQPSPRRPSPTSIRATQAAR